MPVRVKITLPDTFCDKVKALGLATCLLVGANEDAIQREVERMIREHTAFAEKGNNESNEAMLERLNLPTNCRVEIIDF